MDKVADYWVDKKPQTGIFHSANVNLFRLIGSSVGALDNKTVLEVGFGYGADLTECRRRGAEVYGLDLNPLFVDSLAGLEGRIATFRAGQDRIGFGVKFDLIYFNDLIYYLDDREIQDFLIECRRNLAEGGRIVFQFIEKDLEIPDNDPLSDYSPELFASAGDISIFPEENPIRFLKTSALVPLIAGAGLKIIASKRVLQSYDLKEQIFRLDKFLVLSAA